MQIISRADWTLSWKYEPNSHIGIDWILYWDSDKDKGRSTEALWRDKEYDNFKQERNVNYGRDKKGERMLARVKKR